MVGSQEIRRGDAPPPSPEHIPACKALQRGDVATLGLSTPQCWQGCIGPTL